MGGSDVDMDTALATSVFSPASSFCSNSPPEPTVKISVIAADSTSSSLSIDSPELEIKEEETNKDEHETMNEDEYQTLHNSSPQKNTDTPTERSQRCLSHQVAIGKWDGDNAEDETEVCAMNTVPRDETKDKLHCGSNHYVSIVEKILIEEGCGNILNRSEVEAVEQELAESCDLTSNELEEILQEAEAENRSMFGSPLYQSASVHGMHIYPPDANLPPSMQSSLLSVDESEHDKCGEADDVAVKNERYPSLLPSLTLSASSSSAASSYSSRSSSINYDLSSEKLRNHLDSVVYRRTLWRETPV